MPLAQGLTRRSSARTSHLCPSIACNCLSGSWLEDFASTSAWTGFLVVYDSFQREMKSTTQPQELNGRLGTVLLLLPNRKGQIPA